MYAINISNRTGTVKVTKPDGTTITVQKDDLLPDILPNSTVDLLDGCMDIEPAEGSVQVIAGNSVATVDAGDRVTACIDSETGMAGFTVHAGEIETATIGDKAEVPEGALVTEWEQIGEPGFPTGKTPVFVGINIQIPSLSQEEPLEPERLEGSSFRP
ncbi:MAG: hypothetical protein L0956_10900 [Candidatus Mariimomonas ferrooxydans]